MGVSMSSYFMGILEASFYAGFQRLAVIVLWGFYRRIGRICAIGLFRGA